jgi:hypothetical protein
MSSSRQEILDGAKAPCEDCNYDLDAEFETFCDDCAQRIANYVWEMDE